MKVAFVVQRYGRDVVGGAERFTQDLATGLAADGHEIHVVTSCATSYADWADVYEPGTTVEDGVVLHRCRVVAPRDNDRFIPLHLRMVDASAPPMWPWAQDRWSATMGPELDDGERVVADVARDVELVVFVGYHYAQSLRLARWAAAFAPTAVIPTAHPEGAFHAGRVRQMFEYADRVIALAPEEADLIREVARPRCATDVVGCPVEPPPVPDPVAVDDARRRFGVHDAPYLITIGRVDPAKGSDDAVRYTSHVRRSTRRDVRLVVVGPGDVMSDDPGIIATGFVDEDDKLALLAGATALLQPSYMESFSIALIEGWLLERPALVQGRNAVLAGHVRRAGGGLVYTDAAGFRDATVALLDDAALRARLGAAGRTYSRAEFAWEPVEQRFIAAASAAIVAGRARLASSSGAA